VTTLLASAARAVTGFQVISAATAPYVGLSEAARFVLIVSAAAAAAGDTLNVRIQRSYDGGTTYDDFVSFTQVLGNGGAKAFIAEWSVYPTAESEMRAPTQALAAGGVIQGGPMGEQLKITWTIAGSTPNFTFTVLAEFFRQQRI